MEICSHSDKLVANPTHRHDPLRIGGIGLDLAPEVGDVDVARALISDVRAVPEVLHDLLPAEHALRFRGEEIQETELRRRQVDLLVLDAHAMPNRIELEPADVAYLAGDARSIEVPPPQDRAYPPDQL